MAKLLSPSMMRGLDFTQGRIRYRLNHLQGRNELIAKAIGWRQGQALLVVDATAGLGRDAFLIAALGCQVILFERHSEVASTLRRNLEKAALEPTLNPIIKRMQLIEGCAISYFNANSLPYLPDVIYCDPMFEAKKKAAKVKKEMQWLQTCVGVDEDAILLANAALKAAPKRLVIKRALHATLLIENPHLQFKGKSHRFDVYLP